MVGWPGNWVCTEENTPGVFGETTTNKNKKLEAREQQTDAYEDRVNI